MASTALLTDHYELTMVQAALHSGVATRPAVFETFARSLPAGRRYGVVAGLGRLVDAIERFRFTDDELAFLAQTGVVDDTTCQFLADLRFTGDIDAYAEGELYVPGSPVLTVQAPFAEAVVLETLALSILNFDSAVASAASRMVTAAGDRDLLEFGGRRAHEEAAVAAARAAYLAGFSGTSNLAAGRRYGIPTLGTAAHAFTMIHDTEADAFRTQLAALGEATTLLVDTYDEAEAIRTAVAIAGPRLGAIRLDSGDLAVEAKRARSLLDELGAADTRIVASGDLDEHRIAALATAPIDAYGVGTSVVTGSGAPTAGFVFKLVARGTADGGSEPIAKRAGSKSTAGGRKVATRELRDGAAIAERLATGPAGPGRPLQVPVVRAGERVWAGTLTDARAHLAAARGELPVAALDLEAGPVAFPTFLDAQEVS